MAGRSASGPLALAKTHGFTRKALSIALLPAPEAPEVHVVTSPLRCRHRCRRRSGAVLVEAGQTVARGEIVVILEAMKMELPVRAPHDGVVQNDRVSTGRARATWHATPGDAVIDQRLPRRVTVVEVGPRDGLQNESAIVPSTDQGRVHRSACQGRPAGRRDDRVRQPEVGAADGGCCGRGARA